MDFDRTVDSGPCGKRGSFSLDLSPPFDTLLDSCAHRVLEMSGRENVTSIFLGGSFALGEGGVDWKSDIPRLIGDIDLLVAVQSRQSHERLYRMRRELGAACQGTTDEIEFTGSIDVGVMLSSDFESMGPSPFVYDLKHHGIVLYGDGGLLDRIPGHESGWIGGDEAVTLLQNRIVSFLGSFDASRRYSGDDPHPLLYGISKVYADICTAVLCLSKLYTPGYAARSERIREAFEAGKLAMPVSGGMIEAIEVWTRFKLSPSALVLGDATDPGSMSNRWDEAARNLLEWWKRCETFQQGLEFGIETDVCVEVLLSRCSAGHCMDNLRAWRGLASAWPIRRKLRLVLGLRTGMLSTNPIGLVHGWGVRLLERYVKTGTGGQVERPVAAYPHSGGSWEKTVRNVTGAWREIVYGTKDRRNEE